MPYKIVQTIERGGPALVIVPSLWEENGKLWWPPKAYYKLIKDEQSKPKKEEWRIMDCILKRTDIQTYQLAEAELSIMEENSDTDVNDTVVPRMTVAHNQQGIEYEHMVNKLGSDDEDEEQLKIALKDYKNVLKFFHGMIQTWDPTFTVQENEQFFKVITKNSSQRKSMKNLRMSSKRCRKSKDNLAEQQKIGNKRQSNDDKKEPEGKIVKIQEYAPNYEPKEISDGESRQVQEQEMEKENIPLNNMSDDDTDGGLC